MSSVAKTRTRGTCWRVSLTAPHHSSPNIPSTTTFSASHTGIRSDRALILSNISQKPHQTGIQSIDGVSQKSNVIQYPYCKNGNNATRYHTMIVVCHRYVLKKLITLSILISRQTKRLMMSDSDPEYDSHHTLYHEQTLHKHQQIIHSSEVE